MQNNPPSRIAHDPIGRDSYARDFQSCHRGGWLSRILFVQVAVNRLSQKFGCFLNAICYGGRRTAASGSRNPVLPALAEERASRKIELPCGHGFVAGSHAERFPQLRLFLGWILVRRPRRRKALSS